MHATGAAEHPMPSNGTRSRRARSSGVSPGASSTRQATMSGLSWVYVGILGLMAGFTLVLGVRGLVRRRPIVFSARWLFAFIGLAFAPSLIGSLRFGLERSSAASEPPVMTLIMPAM